MNHPKIKRPHHWRGGPDYDKDWPLDAFAAWTRRYWPHLLVAGALFLAVALAGWGR